MSNANHTPGPWVASDGGYPYPGAESDSVVTADGGMWIGEAHQNADDLENPDVLIDLPTEANARLMAAAPELLAALEKAIKWLANIPQATNDFDLSSAAVAKAKGRILMACTVEGNQLFCTTADVYFGPSFDSYDEADAFRSYCYRVLDVDPRAFSRPELERLVDDWLFARATAGVIKIKKERLADEMEARFKKEQGS